MKERIGVEFVGLNLKGKKEKEREKEGRGGKEGCRPADKPNKQERTEFTRPFLTRISTHVCRGAARNGTLTAL